MATNTNPVSPKATAATVAGAITLLLVWIAGMLGLEVPPEAAAAITTLLVALAAYLKRDPRRVAVPPDGTGVHRAGD